MSKLSSLYGRAAVVLAALGALAAAGATQAALAATPAGTWGKAIEVPGTATLNAGKFATVGAISCPSVGNCSAGGYYTDHAGLTRPFAVSEKKGVWGKAVKVSGPAALNTSKFAQISTISCGSPGNCLAGGGYALAGGKQAFVVTEKNGTWGKATAVPGLNSLDSGYVAEVDHVACPSVGNCTVVGEYSTLELSLEVFVASEKNGKWIPAVEIPGTAQLNQYGRAHVNSLACPSAGNCVVVGDYRDISQLTQAFMDTEKNGVWDIAAEIAGTQNAGGLATATSVSCATAGNCAVGGEFLDSSSRHHAFVVTEAGGIWGQPGLVTGQAAFTSAADAHVDAVSCATASSCVAAGAYGAVLGENQAFVVTLTNGSWGKAALLPGLASLNTGDFAQVTAISCRSAGNCSIGGSYRDKASVNHAFVDTEKNGSWAKAVPVPGIATLSGAGRASGVLALSCASAGHCVAGGSYYDRKDFSQAFVVSEG